MPYSRFATAKVIQSGGDIKLRVTGPIGFAADEQLTTMVTSLSFVVVQGEVFVHGSAGDTVRGKGDWVGDADGADQLVAGDAQGFGVLVFVRRPLETAQESATLAPLVQTLNWSEPITITT